MSLVPTREDEAFGAGYRQASEAGGRVIDHFSKRLNEVEVQRDMLVIALKAARPIIAELKRTSFAGPDLNGCLAEIDAALAVVGQVKRD